MEIKAGGDMGKLQAKYCSSLRVSARKTGAQKSNNLVTHISESEMTMVLKIGSEGQEENWHRQNMDWPKQEIKGSNKTKCFKVGRDCW